MWTNISGRYIRRAILPLLPLLLACCGERTAESLPEKLAVADAGTPGAPAQDGQVGPTLADAGSPVTGAMPACLQSLIQSQLAQNQAPPYVARYQYHGQTVYYFAYWGYDDCGLLYDEQCTLLCAPDGCFSGTGDGKCPDFGSATRQNLVWKNPNWTDPQRTQPLPPCISDLIQTLKSGPVANPPASLTQYDYQGKKVFYLPPRCCDIPSVLYDDECHALCAPDGGFFGTGDGKCPDFLDQAAKVMVIWTDPR